MIPSESSKHSPVEEVDFYDPLFSRLHLVAKHLFAQGKELFSSVDLFTKWIRRMVQLGLLINVCFSSGGLKDYYVKNKLLEDKEDILHEIQVENEHLYDEIMKIQTDKIYQKKLVRDILGLVAEDEFLILFSKKK